MLHVAIESQRACGRLSNQKLKLKHSSCKPQDVVADYHLGDLEVKSFIDQGGSVSRFWEGAPLHWFIYLRYKYQISIIAFQRAIASWNIWLQWLRFRHKNYSPYLIIADRLKILCHVLDNFWLRKISILCNTSSRCEGIGSTANR